MIHLSDLGAGFTGITPSLGRSIAEAGAVSLEAQGHVQGKTMEIRGALAASLPVHWDSPTDQTRESWADPEEATEYGAAGIAILLVKKYKDYSVLKRSRKGSGFDYWLGKEPTNLFQDYARLEVSGIQNGDSQDVKRRVSIKLKQIEPSDNLGLPGIIVVVEFGQPLAEMREK